VGHVKWSAIFAGTVITLVVMLTLIMLGLAVGFATINPATEENPFGGLGIGTAVWWVISSIIAYFVGGWVSSRVAGLQRVFDGALHGLVTWGLVTLLTMFMLTSTVGFILGGAFGLVSNVVSATGQAAGAIMPQIAGAVSGAGPVQDIIQEAEQTIDQNLREGVDAQTVIRDLGPSFYQMLQGGVTEQERQQMISQIQQYTTLSEQEIQGVVQRMEARYQELGPQVQQQLQRAQQTAQQMAGQVADALAKAALASFIMLILSGAAAALGGWLGRVSGAVRV
jgi:LytS/YehU family sensor histidine kinase